MSSTLSKTRPLPTLFLSHGGGPGFFMKAEPGSPFAEISQDSIPHKALKAVAANKAKYRLPEAPKSIVVVSAHWETSGGFRVFSVPKPTLYYDYYGFPQHTYQLKYPAPGNDELAHRIVDLINNFKSEGKLPRAAFDSNREGWDHGVFVPLMILYPEAHIPIVQVSITTSHDPLEHYYLGKALAPLRSEGVFIIASGQATHPMSPGGSADKTERFMQLMNTIVTDPGANEDVRREGLVRMWKNPLMKATHIPTTEHLIPLVVAAGATDGSPGQDLFRKGKDLRFMNGLFSFACYVFGESENDEEARLM